MAPSIKETKSNLIRFKAQWIKLKNWIDRQPQKSVDQVQYDIQIPGVMFFNFEDWGLLFDEGIFQYKIPNVLLDLLSGSYQDAINLMQDITDWEIRTAKIRTVNDCELTHVINLKTAIDTMLDYRYPEYKVNRNKVLAGDYRRKTHYTL
jgi:hypothetical protein